MLTAHLPLQKLAYLLVVAFDSLHNLLSEHAGVPSIMFHAVVINVKIVKFLHERTVNRYELRNVRPCLGECFV